MQKYILTCRRRRMKHLSIYFGKVCAYLGLSISIQMAFWGTSFITGMRLITFSCFWYYKKMHNLRLKKLSSAFMSHLLFVGYIFQSQHLQGYYKRGLSIVWRRRVPTSNRYVSKCGRNHSDLFLKIDTPKRWTNSMKNTLKGVSFG